MRAEMMTVMGLVILLGARGASAGELEQLPLGEPTRAFELARRRWVFYGSGRAGS